jgi:hypothetical protein
MSIILTTCEFIASDGILHLPEDIANRLPRTSEIYYEPGQYIYGISVFHQLHCLNIIRQSFYPERYRPKRRPGLITYHKSKLSSEILSNELKENKDTEVNINIT